MENILEVRNLKISFRTFFGEVEAVRGITFSVARKKPWLLWENQAAGSRLLPVG